MKSLNFFNVYLTIKHLVLFSPQFVGDQFNPFTGNRHICGDPVFSSSRECQVSLLYSGECQLSSAQFFTDLGGVFKKICAGNWSLVSENLVIVVAGRNKSDN
jgi:hypothetical protein